MAESHSDQSENESESEIRENNPHNEEDDSENESADESSDSDDDGGGLLDTMAADSSGEESSDEEEEDEHYDMRDDTSDDYFHKFCQLPPELRHRVWEFFCPELCARYRVLDFQISYGTARHPEAESAFVWTVRDGIALGDQTKNLRTVFAVHKDSRALATNAFPHSLSIDAGPEGDATVPFNRNSDVVLMNGLSCPPGRMVFHLPGFASEIKNFALGGPNILDDLSGPDVPSLLSQFTQLEYFYVNVSSTDCQKSSLAWCTSDLINRYQTQTYEHQPGLGEDLQFLWCWPDLQRHPDFARFQIDRDTWDNLPDPLGSELERRGLKAWPMVAFEYERGLRRHEMLQTLGPDMGDSDSSDEDEEEDDDDGDNGPDLDEYESDGIDDDEIVETYDPSDEEGISLASGSPAPAPRQLSDDEDEDDGAGANFSSPEPEPESAPAPRGRKRRVVSDSDEEEDEDVEPTAKRARTDRVVESDEEDEDEDVQDRSRQRSRAIVSDDDDEDENQGGVSRKEEESDSEENQQDSEEESEEESDDEDAPPKKLSLAERLRLGRQENPIDESDNDASSRTADEESEDDDDEERNPFMMGMADESDGEGEDGYDDDDGY
ncbi:hypothetical protein F53441_915 [Fusarium austroafricanum]|uniref:2EXR domain-containing protein n=1 Tax=Fusarium austroafricanum TaxID=2364996 RepID=A0A8H4PE08_9HYPO|nr:hypothetical protein F53441_915 [Fusarium austroafricanum]